MRKFLLLAGFLTLLGLGLSFLKPSFFEVLEGKLYDIHFVLRGELPSSGKVTVVTIDEKSLQTLGRWPWPRTLFARAFQKLASQGALVVAPDIFFAEPSRDAEGERHDAELAETLAANRNIMLGYYMLMTEEEVQESSLDPARLEANFELMRPSAWELGDLAAEAREVEGIQAPLARLSEVMAAGRHGFFNTLNDSDGTVRKTPLFLAYRDRIFPSLALQIAKTALEVSGRKFLPGEIPLDDEGDFLVNYRGSSRSFRRVGMTELMEDPSLRFDGEVVLVGATATGLEDNRPTPVDPTTPSVILSANVIDNLLTGDFLVRNPMTEGLSRLLIVMIGLLLGVSLCRLDATRGFLLFLGVTAAELLLFHLLFLKARWVLQNFYPLFSGFLVYLGTTLYRYLVEEREKRLISSTFEHYLSGDVIRELHEHPEKLRLGGERKELTIFFSDIRDFATIVESTPAEVIVGFLNSYLSPVTDEILGHKGLLDKYIGDAVMAVFGAPLAEPEHRKLACESALKIIRVVQSMQGKWRQEFNVSPVRIGIGINTGLVTVGNMGSERRFDYTVIGDPVNLASRLEGLNKFYGTTILASQNTYEPVKDLFPFREIDEVNVKGKKEAVRIYELVDQEGSASQQVFKLFQEGLQYYREGKFAVAKAAFEKCLSQSPEDGPSKVFLERCRQFEQAPPAEWSGITAFQKK